MFLTVINIRWVRLTPQQWPKVDDGAAKWQIKKLRTHINSLHKTYLKTYYGHFLFRNTKDFSHYCLSLTSNSRINQIASAAYVNIERSCHGTSKIMNFILLGQLVVLLLHPLIWMHFSSETRSIKMKYFFKLFQGSFSHSFHQRYNHCKKDLPL